MFAPGVSIFKDTIVVTIAVFPPLPGETDPRLCCAPFIVPKGNWTIVWNLVTVQDSPRESNVQLAYATFPDEMGIYLLLSQDINFDSSNRVSETQWVTSLPCYIDKKVYALSYVIKFNYGPANNRASFSSENRKVIDHDPTIVVSKDPIEPPIGSGGE